MDKDVNSMCALGGVMICSAFVSYIFISYALAYVLGFLGVIVLLAGMLTLDSK